MSKASNKKVTIYERINKLRLKAGIPLSDDSAGHIDPTAVKKAQVIIDEGQEDYRQEIEAILVKLDSSWEDLKACEESHKKMYLDQIYNYSNNIKDIASTYGYGMMNFAGASLRDFCERIDVNKEEHHVIVQAHIDVMWVTFEENIKADDEAKAEELKLLIKKAIEKYF